MGDKRRIRRAKIDQRLDSSRPVESCEGSFF